MNEYSISRLHANTSNGQYCFSGKRLVGLNLISDILFSCLRLILLSFTHTECFGFGLPTSKVLLFTHKKINFLTMKMLANPTLFSFKPLVLVCHFFQI